MLRNLFARVGIKEPLFTGDPSKAHVSYILFTIHIAVSTPTQVAIMIARTLPDTAITR